MRLPIQLECIVFRRKEDAWEFLLLRRIPSKGGFWQPVTGGLEEEDVSLEHCCKREVMEETGIAESDIVRIIPHVHKYTFTEDGLDQYGYDHYTEFIFGVEISRTVDVHSHNNVYDEHDEMKWVSYEEALSLLKWEDNKEGLRKLKAKL